MIAAAAPMDTPIAMALVLFLPAEAAWGEGVSLAEPLEVEEGAGVVVAVPGNETAVWPKSLTTTPASTSKILVSSAQQLPWLSPSFRQQYRPPLHCISSCHPDRPMPMQNLGHASEDHDLSVQAPRNG
ncbi:MAG: hypothetical protein M1813_001256 [Trichoglossum hirsutum]|nr:MAG: hypothetical protein M1813_001256 [Trichoglossum hirsutum]